MTRNQDIDHLLAEVPEEALPVVVNFLRALARQQKATPRPTKSRRKHTPLADRTFASIPADPAIVRQILSEDLYDAD